MAADPRASDDPRRRAWRGFNPGPWKSRVNLRDFIQRNYTPYAGDASFLAGATERTRKVWEQLLPLLAEERERGVLAVSQEPSSILAHDPGYIDHGLELIVGLQTDAPPEACDHAEGRLARCRGEPQGIRLPARPKR